MWPVLGPPAGKEGTAMHVKRAGLLTKILVLVLLVAVASSLLELNNRLDQAQDQYQQRQPVPKCAGERFLFHRSPPIDTEIL